MAHEPTHNQTKHWQALDAAHHVHPFSDTAALNKEGVRVITRADGVYLWDSEGHKIIDGMAGLWCVQVGYGNEELAEAGCEALKTLPYYNHFFKTTNPYTVELAAKMATRGPGVRIESRLGLACFKFLICQRLARVRDLHYHHGSPCLLMATASAKREAQAVFGWERATMTETEAARQSSQLLARKKDDHHPTR